MQVAKYVDPNDVDALAVECPVCSVFPTFPCRKGLQVLEAAHKKRTEAARVRLSLDPDYVPSSILAERQEINRLLETGLGPPE